LHTANPSDEGKGEFFMPYRTLIAFLGDQFHQIVGLLPHT